MANNSGTYLPEKGTMRQIAAYESVSQRKTIHAGTLIRQAIREWIAQWQEKNPKKRLTL